VVVCTRNRPAELTTCLRSIAAAGARVAEVVVGDDGTDAVATTATEVVDSVAGLPPCRVVQAPRAGLAANRNACVDVVTGDYVLFLDDDATLDAGFVDVALAAAGPDRIVTGFEWQATDPPQRVEPHAPDFLGYLRLPRGVPLATLVINSAVFPSDFVREHGFDEFFRFGSEEIEMALLARHRGLTIAYVDAGNHHAPSLTSRGDHHRETLRSKGYFGMRRYREYQPSRWRRIVFAVVGTASAFRGGLRRRPRGGRAAASAFLEGVRRGRHPGLRRQLPRSANP
jgi:glycosyltransferase involved in cell wall biosynthesis